MGLIDRLLGRKTDDRAELRPLWHRVVEVSRARHWYAQEGVPDTLEGRFDMITAVLTIVMLRMEQDEALIPGSVRLTELFVHDMDGQLREIGVGDLVVGKHMGKLMSQLGGRLGAFREALAEPGDAALCDAVRRNITLGDETDPAPIAARLRSLAEDLARLDAAGVLAARFGVEE